MGRIVTRVNRNWATTKIILVFIVLELNTSSDLSKHSNVSCHFGHKNMHPILLICGKISRNMVKVEFVCDIIIDLMEVIN